MRALILGLVLVGGVLATAARATDTVIWLNRIDESGVGPAIGIIHASDTPAGLMLMPDLTGLPPGEHGFHLHENASCQPGARDGKLVAGHAAGGHWDPGRTGRHAGPVGDGHLGDLPVLLVAEDGTARESLIASRLTAADLRGRALVIHAGGDNYSDEPEPLGGGGPRIACGVAPPLGNGVPPTAPVPPPPAN